MLQRIHSELKTSGPIGGFQRELRATSRETHPHIALFQRDVRNRTDARAYPRIADRSRTPLLMGSKWLFRGLVAAAATLRTV